MTEGYRHLSDEGTCRIYAMEKGGLSNGAIAERLGRGPSTILREFRRNSGEGEHRYGLARRKALVHRNADPSVSRRSPEDRRSRFRGSAVMSISPEASPWVLLITDHLSAEAVSQ